MLVNLAPEVNVTNILQAAFSSISFRQKIWTQIVSKESFEKLWYEKAPHIMLMKFSWRRLTCLIIKNLKTYFCHFFHSSFSKGLNHGSILNITNILWADVMHADPKSAKRQSSIFALLESGPVKALSKHVGEIDNLC